MAQRVSIKTEDLVGILDTHVQNIWSRGIVLKDTWNEYRNIKSFTEFRELEEVFSNACHNLRLCIDTLKDYKENKK